MNAFANHFAYEFKTGLRNTSMLFMSYLFPLGVYVLLTLVMSAVNPLFKATMIPAMCVFAMMGGGLLGMGGPIVEARDAGIYRSFKINGVPAASIIAIPVLASTVHVLVVSLIITLSAAAIFGGALPVAPLAFGALLVLGAFAMCSLGALIGVVATNSRAVLGLSQLIFLPSMVLGGLMMPLAMLPPGMQKVAALLPAAHIMQAIQGLAYGLPTVFDPVLSALVTAAAGLLAFLFAIYLFNWDKQNQVRRGHPALAALALVPYILALAL
ncbi:MAG: ABC transporter permease [Nitrososphaerales archaeon]